MRRLVIVVCCLVGVALGCSQAARDRLGAFFFDIPQDQPAETTARPGAVLIEPLPKLELPGPRFVSFHPPYVLRQCRNCHDAGSRMQVRDDFQEQCRECHPRYYSEEVRHEPVLQGECVACHGLHRSEQPRLLTLPVFDTCLECHDEPEDLSEEAHGSGDVENCISCHDPHFGAESLLRP